MSAQTFLSFPCFPRGYGMPPTSLKGRQPLFQGSPPGGTAVPCGYGSTGRRLRSHTCRDLPTHPRVLRSDTETTWSNERVGQVDARGEIRIWGCLLDSCLGPLSGPQPPRAKSWALLLWPSSAASPRILFCPLSQVLPQAPCSRGESGYSYHRTSYTMAWLPLWVRTEGATERVGPKIFTSCQGRVLAGPLVPPS